MKKEPGSNKMTSTVRINVYLASMLGVSRRRADRIIAENRIKVNGSVAALGQTVRPERDEVTADGLVVENKSVAKTHISLYKPTEYITARSDQWGRKTVLDLLPNSLMHLNPAGRLDYLSEGLLLLSDDGGFNYRYTHPKFETEKEYVLIFRQPVTAELIEGFKNGVQLSEGLAKADRLERISDTSLRVTVHQGWNRQLRRMAGFHKFEIIRLIRTRVGGFTIEGLRPGEWREISPA